MNETSVQWCKKKAMPRNPAFAPLTTPTCRIGHPFFFYFPKQNCVCFLFLLFTSQSRNLIPILFSEQYLFQFDGLNDERFGFPLKEFGAVEVFVHLTVHHCFQPEITQSAEDRSESRTSRVSRTSATRHSRSRDEVTFLSFMFQSQPYNSKFHPWLFFQISRISIHQPT